MCLRMGLPGETDWDLAWSREGAVNHTLTDRPSVDYTACRTETGVEDSLPGEADFNPGGGNKCNINSSNSSSAITQRVTGRASVDHTSRRLQSSVEWNLRPGEREADLGLRKEEEDGVINRTVMSRPSGAHAVRPAEAGLEGAGLLPGEAEKSDFPRDGGGGGSKRCVTAEYVVVHSVRVPTRSVLPRETERADSRREKEGIEKNCVTDHDTAQSVRASTANVLPGKTERADFPREKRGSSKHFVTALSSVARTAAYSVKVSAGREHRPAQTERPGFTQGREDAISNSNKSGRHCPGYETDPVKPLTGSLVQGETEVPGLAPERDGAAANTPTAARGSVDYLACAVKVSVGSLLPGEGTETRNFQREGPERVTHRSVTGRCSADEEELAAARMHSEEGPQAGDTKGLDFPPGGVTVDHVAGRPSADAGSGLECLLPGETERWDRVPQKPDRAAVPKRSTSRRFADYAKHLAAQTGESNSVLPGTTTSQMLDFPEEETGTSQHAIDHSFAGKRPVLHQTAYPLAETFAAQTVLPGEVSERFEFPRELGGAANLSRSGRSSVDYGAACPLKTRFASAVSRDREDLGLIPRQIRGEVSSNRAGTRRHSTPDASYQVLARERKHCRLRDSTEGLYFPGEDRELDGTATTTTTTTTDSGPGLDLGLTGTRTAVDFTAGLIHAFLNRILPRQRERLRITLGREGATNHTLSGRRTPEDYALSPVEKKHFELPLHCDALASSDDFRWGDTEGAASHAALITDAEAWDLQWERELRQWEQDLRWEKDLKVWENNLRWEREGAVNNSMVGRPATATVSPTTCTDSEPLPPPRQQQKGLELDLEREGAMNPAMTSRCCRVSPQRTLATGDGVSTDRATIRDTVSTNHATIRDGVSTNHATIRYGVSTNHATIRDGVSTNHATIIDNVSTNHATIRDGVSTNRATTRHGISTNHATNRNNVSTNQATTRNGFSTNHATNRDNVSTNQATLRDNVSTNHAKLRDTLSTNHATLRDTLSTDHATLRDTLSTDHATIRDGASNNAMTRRPPVRYSRVSPQRIPATPDKAVTNDLTMTGRSFTDHSTTGTQRTLAVSSLHASL